MQLQLLRNATQRLTVQGKTILIDPMLGPKGAYPAFPFTGNDRRNPLTELPMTPEAAISGIDAVLLTHLHLDHWDETAKAILPRDIPVFCQPMDKATIEGAGFTQVQEIESMTTWQGIHIHRTGGQHGTGDIGQRMGHVSGYVIMDQENNHTLYIAGDTIWCPEVQAAIDLYHPDRIVVNGGGARFETGDAIVMTIPDILQVCSFAPAAKIFVVHLESVNHAKETRHMIRSALPAPQCYVPNDGEVIYI